MDTKTQPTPETTPTTSVPPVVETAEATKVVEESVTPISEPVPAPVPEVSLVDTEPIKAAMEATPAPVAGAAVKSKSNKLTIIAVLLVIVALLAVLFRLEQEGRIDTNLFGGVTAALEAGQPVAVVNGEEIDAVDLEVSIDQLLQNAGAQGLDITDPTVVAEVRTQAIEMLVNTALLQQAAATAGINIETEAVESRIAELVEAAGGQEALDARLAEFDIDQAKLFNDVRDELTIRALLDTIFATVDTTVSEIEINTVYNEAVAANVGQTLPPLDEVRTQIEAQLVQTKEQTALDAYLQELRADADITLN